MRDITFCTDQQYLRDDQYRDSRNLSTRHALHARFSTNPRGWLPWAFDQLLALPLHARVLELGCGRGDLWLKNLDRIPAGWEITLSDFSPGMVEEAKKALADLPQATFQVVDVQAIPFPDSSFDAVIANHMLYHVPSIPQALSEIRRVLRPEGRLFAATNGQEHLAELWELLSEFEGAPYELARVSRNFELENAPALLLRHFAHVELHHYQDGLAVTEAEPLVAYALSDSLRQMRMVQEPEAFLCFVQQRLERGPLEIRKSVGMFEAWN